MTKEDLTKKTDQYNADKKEFWKNLKWLSLIVIIYAVLKWIEQP